MLREYGITIEAGAESFYTQAGQKISKVTNELIRKNLESMLVHCLQLKKEEIRIDAEVISFVKEKHPEFYKKAEKLEGIPGIGWTTALLMVAIIDDAKRFSDAQKFGAYLGLIPGQFSSGDKVRMGYITRSGCEMLRRYLIHGGRAVLKCARVRKSKSDIDLWAIRLSKKKGMNKATVAVAHKLARVCFAMVRDGEEFVKNYKKPETKIIMDVA
jgi:transposase